MINEILLYIGSGVIIVWGIAHLFPTKPIVKDFGELSADNRRILIMEWVAEGLTLSFIGVLALLITIMMGVQNPASTIVYRICASMLIVMALLSLFTGARTSIVPIKVCPVVKTVVAILFLLGSIL